LADGEISYKNYYWSHRIDEAGDIWFNQGQFLDTHVPAIG
jgi:hypothetical protein